MIVAILVVLAFFAGAATYALAGWAVLLWTVQS